MAVIGGRMRNRWFATHLRYDQYLLGSDPMFSPRAKSVVSISWKFVKYNVKQAITHKNKPLADLFIE